LENYRGRTPGIELCSMDEAAEKVLNEAQKLEDALTLFTSLATHTLQ